jgi:hypothetical protein
MVPPPKGCEPCKACARGCPYWVRHITFIQFALTTFFSWLCKLISSWTFTCEFILVPILELQHAPLTPKVLWVKERTLTPFVVFTFELTFEFFKQFRGALDLVLENPTFNLERSTTRSAKRFTIEWFKVTSSRSVEY